MARAPSMTAAPPRRPADEDLACQRRLLEGVARTFALTIRPLPRSLGDATGNLYLLCRIADTIEDEPVLSEPRRARLLAEIAGAVSGRSPAGPLAARLAPMLSDATGEGERDLVVNAPLVLGLTHGFQPAQRAAIERCIRVMTEGMSEFGAAPPTASTPWATSNATRTAWQVSWAR